MSEPQAAAPSGGDAPALPLGPGALLRSAREAAGVHIAALAVALKVPVSRLEALEADRFDLMPDPPFVRALAGSVCRVLKIDPAPILALLPKKDATRLVDDVGRGAPRFNDPAGGSSPRGMSMWSRPLMWSVLVLLLAAAALMLLPQARLGAWMDGLSGLVRDRMSESSGERALAAATPDGRPASAGEAVEAKAAAPAGIGSTATMHTPFAPPSASVAAPVSATSATPANAPAVTAAGPAAPPADGVLVLRAKAESWIKVTDAHGAVVLQKMLTAGGTEAVSGALPLAVVIGRADATEVQVRGRPLDLAALSRNNVARFEVR